MPGTLKRGMETFGLYSNRFTTESVLAKIRAVAHNLESIALLPALGLPFVPQTSYALNASAVRIILNDVVLHERHCLLELGAGMSTLYLSRVLFERPGSVLISIEHDARWLEYVGAQLRRMGTQAAVRLVHAPLEPIGTNGSQWYSRATVRAAVGETLLDSVIVDGPKARGAHDSETRSPALPLLATRLNPNGAVVFVDDIKRHGERQIYDRWAQEFSMTQVPDAEFCGLGILAPASAPLRCALV